MSSMQATMSLKNFHSNFSYSRSSSFWIWLAISQLSIKHPAGFKLDNRGDAYRSGESVLGCNEEVLINCHQFLL